MTTKAAGADPHICSVHLPPATSRGPFFFFSSCSASVNSFPPFFSSAEPVSGERTVLITSSHAADRQTGGEQERGEAMSCTQTGKQADLSTHRQTGKHADNDAVHHFTWPLSESLGQHLSCSPVSVTLFERLWKSVISAKIQSCYFTND